jgi:hypothetical protein
MSIEKLIDHERQHIAVVVSESSAGWASNGLAARYQHDFSSNYIGGSSLSRATHRGLGEPERLTAVLIDQACCGAGAIGCALRAMTASPIAGRAWRAPRLSVRPAGQ